MRRKLPYRAPGAQGKAWSCAAAKPADSYAMERKPADDKQAKKPSGRDARRAAALRENLRRRKAQQRQRSALDPDKGR